MVVSSAPQLASTYKLWQHFKMPVDGGQVDAVAIPQYVADQLSSAYTLMVTSMIVNVWAICFAVGFFYIMRHNAELGPLSSNLWNKRASMADSLMSLVSKKVSHWKRWWVYPAIAIIVVCWVSELVLSIVLPNLMFFDTAAPVNVDAIVVPPNTGTSNSETAQLYALDVPAALRAVGGALVAASDVAGRVELSQRDLGTTASFEPIQAVDYAYAVTGHDLGLQDFATLQLSVQGSCRTEYGWLVSSDNSSGYTNDTYAVFGDAAANGHVSLSLYDGPSPVAFFYTGDAGVGLGNITWAAFVSSVDRVSFTPGTDALYYTGSAAQTASLNSSLSTGSNLTTSTNLVGNATYVVQPRRPVLSCWQADVWSYAGRNTTVAGLNTSMVPGLDLPMPLQLTLARYLGAPRIESLGIQLGLGNLQSSTTALGSIFDAGSSSAYSDLRRLALAAFIASANTLTDTTLSSVYLGARSAAGNLIYGTDGKPMPGADAFVVWSADVATVSIRAAIVIPVVAALSWLLVLLVLTYTPLASVNTLDILELQKNIYEKYPDADLTMYDERTWRVQMHIPYVGRWQWGAKGDDRDDVEAAADVAAAAAAPDGDAAAPDPRDSTYVPPAQPIYAHADPVDVKYAADIAAAQVVPLPASRPTSTAYYNPPVQPVYVSEDVEAALAAHPEYHVTGQAPPPPDQLSSAAIGAGVQLVPLDPSGPDRRPSQPESTASTSSAAAHEEQTEALLEKRAPHTACE